MSCECNAPKTITHNCFNEGCSNSLIEEMPHHEKVSNCPVHCHSIAICSGSRPFLCDTCKGNGNYLKTEGHGWGFGPAYVVKNKSVDGACPNKNGNCDKECCYCN